MTNGIVLANKFVNLEQSNFQMKKIILALILSGAAFAISAQTVKSAPEDPGHLTCNNNFLYTEYCKQNGLDPLNNPLYNDFENELNQRILLGKSKKGERSGPPAFIIPIVFHIVHVGGSENISDAQIYDAVNILTRDFRKLNADTASVVVAFQPIIADCEIEFRLAQKDALGNCVSGIDRTFSSKTYDGTNPMVDDVNKKLNGSSDVTNIRYPRNKYLNVWVCIDPNGAAGYTSGPLGGLLYPNYDGIFISHSYLGSIGTSSILRSRTLTHEVGHWFSLSHTWGSSNNPGCNGTIMTPPCSGDDNCTIDDGISDTPNTIGWTSCNLTGATCGSTLDNVQNYMEYSYCAKMFTEGQKAKMTALLGMSISGRNNLHTTANLALTGVSSPPILCAADFSGNNLVICEGDSITFTDHSFNGVVGWNYVFGGGTPVSTTLQNPTITYNAQGTYDAGLIANDGTSYVNTVKSNYVTVLDPVGASAPFSEGFETTSTLPNVTWLIGNTDEQQAWQIATGIGSSGSKCMWIDNFSFNNSGGKDALISKTYDLSSVANVQIHFKYAYKQRVSSDVEKLRVFVSNNCGQSWSQRKLVTGTVLSGGQTSASSYSPAPGDWVSYDVTNITSSFLTQGFMFKIEFESDMGNNMYIDDINLDVNVGINESNFSPTNFNVYPNPVTNQATIQYDLPVSQNITITLKDVLGKQLCVLESGNKAMGNHSIQLNQNQLPVKGIYFVCLSNGVSTFTRKIVVE